MSIRNQTTIRLSPEGQERLTLLATSWGMSQSQTVEYSLRVAEWLQEKLIILDGALSVVGKDFPKFTEKSSARK